MSATVPIIETYAASSTGSDSSDLLNLKKDEGWEDVDPEEDQPLQIQSLFDEKKFPDVQSMLHYCKEQYDFDLLAIRDKLSLDFYALIKMVNFIRSEIKSGHSVTGTITREDFEHDKFLKPVLEDDELLFSLDDLPESKGTKENELVSRVAELEEELRKTQSQFAEYRDTVKQTLDARWNEKSSSETAGPSAGEKRDDDSHYFSSYSYNGTSKSLAGKLLADLANRYPRSNAQGQCPN